MMSALDDLLDKARQMADVAGRKTEEVVEASKNKMQAYKITTNIQRAYEKLGSIVYDSAKYGTDSTQLVESCIAEIDEMLAQLEEVNRKLDASRPGVTCSACGYTNTMGSAYCNKCGASLSAAGQETPEEEQPSSREE